MTTKPVIYHGTPQTPNAAFIGVMPGRAACIRFGRHEQFALANRYCGERIMFDNGAFSAWTKGKPTNWPAFYKWLEPRLTGERWAVIPDIIDAPSQMQDGLLNEWPFSVDLGAPVWHTDEPVNRLLRLCEKWPRVCFGSTGAHWKVGGDDWRARMDEVWPQLGNSYPKIHMLRGVAVARDYPFDSADSSSLAQNGWKRDCKLDFGNPWRGRNAYADHLENLPAFTGSRRSGSPPHHADTNRPRDAQGIRQGEQRDFEGLGLW